ncbi:glycoside hydrolase family 32 protein [Paenibacillus alginolyticus]|uniref:Glycoside hydrolase family 32 protein n=1 Tax=Paenibacillus alginolyticus TaxID=59839 RepID=A0ABT4G5E2_9BACL|nr:glycoside hydrolase family 32 protein [Paenibacillus alginolyticus]MCY9691397.1 glycoside hydrolase family 32 protein [Paenibacillus alginolyticus]MEC0146505.1 glycoside hydrolase family 32 protein [Paenibacillus alginolyticus]
MTNELYRPQFHFSPQQNWMNDPNGLVYFHGEYHLFYQYHPHGTTWGPMHWGHAISKDLVHWEHAPITLEPDEHGQIFSGSAVVDWQDTTGFFNGEVGLVAIFTHHDQDPDSDLPRERQSLAYSSDSGRTWTKYSGNPVLTDSRFPDFRDPKVFWHTQTNQWVMILASGQTVSIYHSANLKDWSFASQFGDGEGAHVGVWECPDLFELAIDGDPARTKWVMLVSIGNSPEHREGSRTQYFIGDFDGTAFKNDASPETVQWLDGGRDNYAGVSWSDIPAKDGRRIYIGWMSNWKYAQVTPTESWRSAMTMPRSLALISRKDQIILVQQPVHELNHLKLGTYKWNETIVEPGQNLLSKLDLPYFVIEAEFELQTAAEFGLKVRTSNFSETVVGYEMEKQEIFVDRSRSGEVSFHADFSGRHAVKAETSDGRLKLQIWVDTSSIEVFAGEGEAVITDLIFPGEEEQGLEIYALHGTVKLISLNITPLKSIWTYNGVPQSNV